MWRYLERKKDTWREWAVRHAEGPYATFWLAFVSFIEASFFPVPPGVLLVAILLSNAARQWWWYAGVTTLFSVLGGLFGYVIGFLFFETLGEPIIAFYGLTEEFQEVRHAFADTVFITMFTAAFTPIPFKVFTIAGGVFRVDLFMFLIASVLGRGIRYGIMAYLLHIFGPRIADTLYRHFAVASFIAVILIILALVVSL